MVLRFEEENSIVPGHETYTTMPGTPSVHVA